VWAGGEVWSVVGKDMERGLCPLSENKLFNWNGAFRCILGSIFDRVLARKML